MSDSFVQGSGGGTKLDITNSIESSVNAMVDIPANSFVFSPKTAQFCKGYCANSTIVGVGTLTDGGGYTNTDKHYWVSRDKVVSVYKSSSRNIGVAVTNVTRDAKGAIISVSTTVLKNSISLGGNLVGVAQLTPTLFACVGYYSSESYYIALQFNSDYSSVSVGSMLHSTDYINNSSTVVVKRLSSSRFFVMFANSSSSTNTDSFSIHVYNVSGTTLTKWAYGQLWGDDRYGMTYNAMVVDENHIVVLRSSYAPLLLDFSSGSVSGLKNTSGSTTVLPTGTEFEYKGITYLIHRNGWDSDSLYFNVAKFEGSTYTLIGSFVLKVTMQFNSNAILNGGYPLVDVNNKRLLIGFTCSDSNAGAYKGDYVICVDLDSAISLNPIVTRSYVCNTPSYGYGIAQLSNSNCFNGVAIGNYSPEYSTIAFSYGSSIVVMNVPIVPDVNLSCSGELIGVTTSKISSGSVGPCLIPTV